MSHNFSFLFLFLLCLVCIDWNMSELFVVVSIKGFPSVNYMRST